MDANQAFQYLFMVALLSGPVIYLVGRLYARRFGDTSKTNPARWLALLALIACDVFAYFVAKAYLEGNIVVLLVGQVALRMDGIAVLMLDAILFLGTMVTLFSITYMAGEVGEEKYYALLITMIGTMIGLCCASDLFNLWIWFEAMAISSYMLVAFYRNQAGALEAGVKYLVQSAAGSVLVLLGIALVFSQTGTLALDQIKVAMTEPSPFYWAAGALFLIGFGVKTALVPMHTWLPDAHSQAPSGISAMLSGVVIEAGLVAMLRALGALSQVSSMWGWILIGFAVINMLAGNLMALRQTQVKRMLAYSSLAHMGYILLGIGLLITFGVSNGGAGAFFHIFTHSMMKGLAFLSVGALMYGLLSSRGDHRPLELDDLNGASRKYPLTAFAFSVAVLALGGLPPLAGFMSKWQIFVAGFEAKNIVAGILVIFAALNSVLSLGYYAPMVNRIYRHEPSELVKTAQPISVWMGLVMFVMVLFIVILGVKPDLINWVTSSAAQSLLATFGG